MNPRHVTFNMEDFEGATEHLSFQEKGAYLQLLIYHWTYGSIPLDPKARAKLLKISRFLEKKLWPNISPFFDSLGRNRRATIEREKAIKTSLRQAMAGHKRWANGNSHGMSHGIHKKSHGTSHGLALLRKKDITSTSSVAARESSTDTGEPETGAAAALPPPTQAKPKPPLAATPELAESLRKKGWVP